MILGWATDVADAHGHIAQREIFDCDLVNLLIAMQQKRISTL